MAVQPRLTVQSAAKTPTVSEVARAMGLPVVQEPRIGADVGGVRPNDCHEPHDDGIETILSRTYIKLVPRNTFGWLCP